MTRLGFILVAASLIAFVTRKQLPNAFLTKGVRREQDEKLPLACAGSGRNRTSNGPHRTLCSTLNEDTAWKGIFVRTRQAGHRSNLGLASRHLGMQ